MTSSKLYPIPSQSLPTIHTSVMLRRLIDNVPDEHFTLDWLISSMPKRSYGIVVFFLALVTLVPFIGVLARLWIMFLALQIMLGYPSPALPQRVMLRKFPSRHLTGLSSFTFSVLTHIERSIRPRWSSILAIRRLSGAILFLIALDSLAVPLPFANVPAAFVMALMALAYLEHDGLLLVVAEAVGCVMLALTAEMVLGLI
jgi:hypothetical protein